MIHEDGSRWANYSYGKPITTRQLGACLKGFVGTCDTVRIPKGTVYKALGNQPAKEVCKGYDLSRFDESFTRYLPPVTDEERKAWEDVAKYFNPAMAGFPKDPV